MWDVIIAERVALTDLLASLSPDEWEHPSLCADWTVHDVAAHMTLQQVSLAGLFGILRQWQGSIDRTNHHVAKRLAASKPPERIVAELRATANNRRGSTGVSRLETLTDLLVHTQDIARPLGRTHDMPPAAAALAATRVLTMRWPPPLPATRKVAGFRLVATDTDWSYGGGPEVRGPISALLLVCTGRRIAAPELSGEGATQLVARIG
ncbi:maleylpyruvate isomerase family mycothiol-dependent enzyme [Paractinoplanes lichenicola]|uniref:Maleylpyruvate isomerase family mycothiol-dependent enzyme n=1 Tax=Paractinoplanes lichenicola TaxID=2802976 RepID=A0ABS1W2Q6_9ACTN|nr:maleylpyruvate isomerase family mycothiol-dependent enzyme [Actinoplanes lichenicola]MBL7261008.1 maleylpyruvate isomerase family mycothiol-dependent enzyme [Actinoplanes lichenicola]